MTKDFKSHLETTVFQTTYRAHFITITEKLNEIIKKSGVTQGSIVVQTHHTTAGLWVNENEKI
jgi:thiamine phosphate synthase YjbQ (UPF0047 family)